jgi:tRNA threonylcarbamoyl adenosine modification protein (Sua5/YciO/YrdC/YwlC family)
VSESVSAAFEGCVALGELVVFPTDTVYGIACDAENRAAVQRLYRLKGRAMEKPSAIMFFDLESALAALPELGPRTRSALGRMLPGRVTVLLPNPERRFPLACAGDPGTLGLRVPSVGLLAGVRWAVLQSSANRSGEADPRRLEDVPEPIREAAGLVLDGGELPGTPSTVVDLTQFEETGSWAVVRPGAVEERQLDEALGWQYHFDPTTYVETIRTEVPAYDRFQDELAAATGSGAASVLELGTGTGETARRLLACHPAARLVGIDVSETMLAVARAALPADRIDLRVARLQDELPAGRFDLVASALCVHHLEAPEKQDLFARIRAALAPGGRFVLADLVTPVDPADVITALTPGYDHPSPLEDQLRWLTEAGLDARVVWSHADLAVLVADLDAR